MIRLLIQLHLLLTTAQVRLYDLREHARHDERGSHTIDVAIWAGAVIVLATLVVAAVKGKITALIGDIN